jgi:hypothetical protein
MLRRWLLALPVLMFVALVLSPAMGQQDKDAPKKDAPKKDAPKKDDKKDDVKKDEKKDDVKKDDKKDTPKDTGEAELVWGFKEGKPFYQKMQTTTDQTMTVSSNQVVQKQKQTFIFEWTPQKKEGENWTIKQKIVGVIMDIDIGNQKIAYDSTKEQNANNPLSEFFKALVGSEFTLTLDKNMDVTKIEGRDAFVNKLTAANPQMKPLLEQILSEKAMTEMAKPTFAALPGTKKKKGDSWSKASTLDMGPIGKYENTYKYTYEGKDEKEKKLDRIKVDTTLKYVEPGENAAANTLPFKIKSADLTTTNATGYVLYDPELKLIAKTSMDLELKGKLTIDIGGQPTQVELQQKQTSTVETSEKNPVAK